MTFVGAIVASIACMACCLRVRGAAHSGGTRQARQSRHAASESIGEDRPGSDAQLLSSTGGRARRRLSGRPRWTSPPFRRGRGPPPNRAKPRSDETGRRRGARRFEPVTPPPTRSAAPTGVRIVRGGVLGNGRLGPAVAPPNQVATDAPRHRSRIEKARYGSVYVVGKVRLSPSVESDRGTGPGGTRRLPREPVPEGSSTPD